MARDEHRPEDLYTGPIDLPLIQIADGDVAGCREDRDQLRRAALSRAASAAASTRPLARQQRPSHQDRPAHSERQQPVLRRVARSTVDAQRRRRAGAPTLGPARDVAQRLRPTRCATGHRDERRLVHGLPDLADHPPGAVVPVDARRRRAVGGVRAHRNQRGAHRSGQAGGRHRRVARHPERRRPLRPHQHADRPGVRNRGRIPRPVRRRGKPRRQRHRRHRARPHRQGGRLPARRDGIQGLPGHLPHGRDPARGLGAAARRA